MRVAIPITDGRLSLHFGHCEHFAIMDTDIEKKEIAGKEIISSPGHQPGLLPVWLAEQGVSVVIAGGMGIRAQDLFRENRIEVIVGAQGDDPERVALDYLEGILETGPNVCDH